jgi:beta-N-acetylhexosaminidase
MTLNKLIGYLTDYVGSSFWRMSVFVFLALTCPLKAQTAPTPTPLSEALGQMIVVGFKGTQFSVDSALGKMIRSGLVGGVLILEDNIESPRQLRRLISDMQSLAKTPLIIAIDQEGGLISRLRYRIHSQKTGFFVLADQKFFDDQGRPYSHDDLAAKDPDFVGEYGRMVAEELISLGINVNLAPVVDLASNEENHVIRTRRRSFGSSSTQVSEYAEKFIDGQKQYGFPGVAKHFPGHGGTSGDSHHGPAVVFDRWTEDELKPYEYLISKNKLDLVLTAHVKNKFLDDVEIASLSPQVINGILRRKMGFDGVVMTDVLNMNAIIAEHSIAQAAGKAVVAGSDILTIALGVKGVNEQGQVPEEVVAQTVSVIHQHITSLIKDGVISEERIFESQRRIKALKDRLPKPGIVSWRRRFEEFKVRLFE